MFSSSEIILGAGDGSIAKINRKTMKIEEESKVPGGVCCLTQTSNSLFIVSTKGTIFNVRHTEPLSKVEFFSSGHSAPIN